MRSYAEQRAMHARMEDARAETERHLAIIESQIVAKAERMTITVRTKSRQFGPNSSTWTRADERSFQEHMSALRFERRCELKALTRKLARQIGAIAAFRVRYRIDQESEQTGL
ncbi:hypothetical protein NKH60_28435 [Mesorhizobium sp. M1006]|uniref:hypothetical protein n=1 Tax=Mesorhizobium sp. M1006 TaxID=2957048 RepID=UPI00333B4FB7